MSSTLPLSNLRVSVACGPVPCDTEEGRSILQKRQALFGQICFLLSMSLFLFFNLILTLSANHPWTQWVSTWNNQVHLGISLAFLAVFLICRIKPLNRFVLGSVDVIGTLLVGLLIGLNYCPEHLTRADYHGILAVALTLVIRAFVVPSSALQTVLTSGLAVVPVIIGYHAAFVATGTSSSLSSASLRQALADTPELSVAISTAVLTSWCIAVVAVAAFASHILYGLRQEVLEAQQLGQYTLEGRIGKGGMGEVYRASHALLRRPTAVKVLRAEKAGEKSIARFEREVQLTSRLTHPNTIAIYDYGHTPDGLFYYAMEYLEGFNLEELVVKTGPQPPSRVIHILRQVCASLSEAHDIGLIHRDVKPANIILCERGGVKDVVKVLDFGLVKNVESKGDLTLSGVNTIAGSPLYMAPEAIRSPREVTPLSDIYAVGAVGYYLITGKPLFEGESIMEICGHHLHTKPVPPSLRLGRTVTKDLEDLILAALEKDPKKRPQDSRALGRMLDECKDAGKWTADDISLWWERVAPQLSGPDVDREGVAAKPAIETVAAVSDEPTKSVIVGAELSGSGQTNKTQPEG